MLQQIGYVSCPLLYISNIETIIMEAIFKTSGLDSKSQATGLSHCPNDQAAPHRDLSLKVTGGGGHVLERGINLFKACLLPPEAINPGPFLPGAAGAHPHGSPEPGTLQVLNRGWLNRVWSLQTLLTPGAQDVGLGYCSCRPSCPSVAPLQTTAFLCVSSVPMH